MSVERFCLPDLGEGLIEAEILSWHVSPGDELTLNQIFVEVETAKAVVELPSPFAGRVVSLHAATGATVNVGDPIITVEVLDDSGFADARGPRTAPVRALPDAREFVASGKSVEQEHASPAVLVGYGPKAPAAHPRRRLVLTGRDRVSLGETELLRSAHASDVLVGAAASLAKPPIRKLARDLKVDLARLIPSGPAGTITRQDVRDAWAACQSSDRPARSDDRADVRLPIKGVRKATAEAMVASAFSAPHVTEWLTVDVTSSVELVERLKVRQDLDVRISPLLLVCRAMVLAVRRTPIVNATWDGDAGNIVMRRAVNLGVAAATPRGLLVPIIKDADTMSLSELASALADVTLKARSGKIGSSDLEGGTITVTNIGVFGVDAGTPIINPGQASILAVGAIRPRPWVVDAGVTVRQVTTLALSFDHRMVDGAEGSRFLADVGAILSNPGESLLF